MKDTAAIRLRWLADTHERTAKCKPCGLNPQHCDIHGKRFAVPLSESEARLMDGNR